MIGQEGNGRLMVLIQSLGGVSDYALGTPFAFGIKSTAPEGFLMDPPRLGKGGKKRLFLSSPL
jgi:hypothetical protein